MSKPPRLLVECVPCQPGSRCVSVRNLDPELLAARIHPEVDQLLHRILRVRVAGGGVPEDEGLPDVCGRYLILEDGVRFLPHFPFEPGVSYRASFDPRPLGRAEFWQVRTLDFSLPGETNVVTPVVRQVYPSSDSLPENLLRFYVHFSNSMQRGGAEDEIRLLGPDGWPVPDALYRPPVELWDRNMRSLTVLLDPGRLKRGVGPNRELGPPLKVGTKYTLAIGAGMVDLSGRPLRESFYKSFRVTHPVRERIAVEEWKLVPPATRGRQPLVLVFPRPLDWALLRHAITIAPEGGEAIHGRISIDERERRWSFTPASPWASGVHYARVASTLEDVCGNTLTEAFDRPLRSGNGLAIAAHHAIPFHLA